MDINIINIIVSIILLTLGYLIGSIPNAIWIGKVFFHKDPRDYGSGNAGGTNAGRVFGKKVGVIVILLDALKAILPLYLAWYILTKAPIYHGGPLVAGVENTYLGIESSAPITWPIYWLTTFGCSIGHCRPIFANFKGGKNVSVFFGTAVATSWAYGFVPALVFFLVLKLKKYVSLASLCASWFSVIIAWVWTALILSHTISGETALILGYGCGLDISYMAASSLTFGVILLTYFHKPNIVRLLNHSESKIKWMK